MKNKEKLIQVTEEMLPSIRKVPTRKKKFREAMTKYSVAANQSVNVLYEDTPLDSLNSRQLYYVYMSANIALEKDTVNVSNYFDEEEIEQFLSQHTKETKIYPIILVNCLPVRSDQWVTTVDAKTLEVWSEQGAIRYNKNTQRNTTKTFIKGKEKWHITINKQSVEQICNLMNKDEFIPNSLTFNLNLDNPDTDFTYDSSTATLTIHSGQLDIIDGYHRFRGLMKARMENPDFNYPMILNIVSFDEQTAINMIVQEDKRNKINTQYIRSLDSTNPVYRIVSRLREDRTSYLYQKIGRDDELEKISFNILFSWIDYLFQIRDNRDTITLTKSIKALFNYIIEEQMIDIQELKMMEIGMILYALKQYGEQQVYTILPQLFEKVKPQLSDSQYAVVGKRALEKIQKTMEGGIENVQ